ncbi:MAG TPA: phytanoyl-CoA dioxygenase family protein [Thermohalobaculum sp.]|nr:phytanoyl-CoA dioxygenase family protein [Thermohalobaculum sp.]
MATAAPVIGDSLIEDFQRDGCAVIRGLFAPWVEGARVGIEENMAAPSFRERTYVPDDGSAPFFQDFCNWDRIPGYRALVRESAMAETAARLMGSRTARIFHDHVLVKEPGTSIATPWHQDQPYYLCEGRQSVSFWIPLDPVPRERTLEFVAGSHLWGKDFRADRFDGTNLYPGDTAESVPDVGTGREQFDIRGWAMEPGDAAVFNFRTLHGAPANASAVRRRVISVRWVGDDARFAKRLGRTSPPFPDLEYSDGAIFDAPEFPVLYPA